MYMTYLEWVRDGSTYDGYAGVGNELSTDFFFARCDGRKVRLELDGQHLLQLLTQVPI